MKKVLSFKTFSLVLAILMLATLVPMSVFAKNTEGVSVITKVEIFDLRTPYIGEAPDYDVKLGDAKAYTYDNQLADDPDVVDGKWWYDETSKEVVNPDDTFIEGHIYSFCVLLVTNDGYEFQVDNFDTPFIKGYINNKAAIVKDNLTDKFQTYVTYTFDPCSHNPEITEVEIFVEELVSGGNPNFYGVEIFTDGVFLGTMNSPYYIEGVAWYDCKNHVFLDASNTIKEDGVYELNVVLATDGTYYFTDDVKATVNGMEAEVGGAGKDGKYNILVSCVVYGDAREEISYVEVTNIKEPSVGANPIFTASSTNNKFTVTGVYWTDVTNTSAVNLKEDDVFEAGHTYNLEVWIRANSKYKFSTDDDGYIDIMALIGGHQADVMLPGSEVSAELSVTFTLSENRVISFVEVTNVTSPKAGRTPDYYAFCTTHGCNVSQVSWYDITDGRGVLMTEDDTFEAGRKYEVVVKVDAEGNYTYEVDDIGANIAEGTINGEATVAYSSYDDSYLELGYAFEPCENDNSKIADFVEIDGIIPPEAGKNPEYDAVCYTPGCEIVSVDWYKVTDDGIIKMNSDSVFEAGCEYKASVTVEALYEYTFPMNYGYNAVKCTINGYDAVADKTTDNKSVTFNIEYSIEEDKHIVGILGDANEDGKVNVKDATAIQKHIANLITLTETGEKLADADENTKVNIKDATAIQKFVAGLPVGNKIGDPVA